MGYRAVHEMSVQGKAIAARFYGNSPAFALWNGCSQGGRQGITEAERYPADYDAIIAGAPSIYQMQLNGARVAINRMAHRSADSYIPPAKYPLVHQAVLEACDALDGVKDGVLEDPVACRFDPGALLCKGADSASCLTAAQVETARAMYGPTRNPSTGADLSVPLLVPGTELGWATLAGPEPLDIPVSGFKYVVFKDPGWDPHTFDTARDVARGLAADNGVIDKTDPNLAPFFGRGGKLLMYHGWADPQVAPLNSVKYFGDVQKTVGRAAVGTSIQLYMVPGMGHCSGGVGPNTFDKVAAMDRWIATGRAPEAIVASHSTNNQVDRTRPLCPYGQVAKWNGAGSTDEAASFACAAR
jgi:feruloyl esterase